MQQRFDIVMERKAAVESQVEEFNQTLELIEYKRWYYKTASNVCNIGAIRLAALTMDTVVVPWAMRT